LLDIHNLEARVFSGLRISGVLELAYAEAASRQLVSQELALFRHEGFDGFGAVFGKRLMATLASGGVRVPADEEGAPSSSRRPSNERTCVNVVSYLV
jgi:hypothetical protein